MHNLHTVNKYRMYAIQFEIDSDLNVNLTIHIYIYIYIESIKLKRMN